jgi:hypothetical protein
MLLGIVVGAIIGPPIQDYFHGKHPRSQIASYQSLDGFTVHLHNAGKSSDALVIDVSSAPYLIDGYDVYGTMPAATVTLRDGGPGYDHATFVVDDLWRKSDAVIRFDTEAKEPSDLTVQSEYTGLVGEAYEGWGHISIIAVGDEVGGSIP